METPQTQKLQRFVESLSPRGQARVAGFLATVAGEKAPEDLVPSGYGQEADVFADEAKDDYAAGHAIATALLEASASLDAV